MSGFDYFDGAEISEEVLVNLLGAPKETVSNGTYTVAMYKLNEVTIFTQSGDSHSHLSIMPEEFEMLDYFHDWEFGDVDPATGLAEFGLRPRLIEANADSDSVRIWKEYNYSVGTLGAPTDDFVRDEEHEIIVFDSLIEAQAWLDENDSGTYHLQYGEMGRPNYTLAE